MVHNHFFVLTTGEAHLAEPDHEEASPGLLRHALLDEVIPLTTLGGRGFTYSAV